MKIFVVNPPFKKYYSRSQRWPVVNIARTYLRYPDWIAYLTAVLEREKEFDVKLLDCIAMEWSIDDLKKMVKSEKPELTVIDSTTPSILYDIECARACKSAFDTKVVFVGPHTTVYPKETLKFADDAIDFVARGEYEYTVLKLAKFVKNNNDNYSKILGLSFIENGNVYNNPNRPLIKNLDELPFPAWHQLDIRKYSHHMMDYPYIDMIGGRGCPYRCIFCQWPQVMHGRTYRYRSPKNIVDEMEYNVNNYGIREILFEDDTFTANRERAYAICNEIFDKGMKVKWSCNVRCDVFDLELLKRMKESGCQTLIIGPETGNQQILNNIRKGITIKQIKEFVMLAKKAKLKLHACYVLGLPGETEETMKQTINFSKELDTETIQVASAIPQVGTEFYNWAVEKGYFKPKSWNDYTSKEGEQTPLIEYPNLSADTIGKYVNRFFFEYYYRPKMVYRELREFKSPRKAYLRTKSLFFLTLYIIKNFLSQKNSKEKK